MKKQANIILTIVFMIFIFSISVLNIITPDKKFSESENRNLAGIPKLTCKNIKTGRFSKKFETYITDQFAIKDFWVALKFEIERITLKKENNGIFFGKDEYLLEDYKKPDNILDINIDSINAFANKVPDIKTYFMLVPNSVKIYENKLPRFASPCDQLKIINYVKQNLNKNVNLINVYNKLNNKKNEYIYFRTDHHWTMRGAYYAYKVLCDSLGIKAFNMDYFKIKKITDSFYGTYFSKANNRHIYPDSIEIFESKKDMKYNIYFYENDKYTDKLYEFNHLKTKDKYSVFLDGNHSLMTIKTDIKTKDKILIFKDSYANCFIPFLVNHYSEIYVIDLRYYKLNLYEYIRKNNINKVLFLYNVSTFSFDENIKWLK